MEIQKKKKGNANVHSLPFACETSRSQERFTLDRNIVHFFNPLPPSNPVQPRPTMSHIHTRVDHHDWTRVLRSELVKKILDFVDARDLTLNVCLVSGPWKRALLTLHPRCLNFHPENPEMRYPDKAIDIMCGRLPNVNSAIFHVGCSPRFNFRQCAYVMTKIARHLKILEINLIEDTASGYHQEIKDHANTLEHLTDLGSLESFSLDANGQAFSYICISNLLTRSRNLKTLRLNGCVNIEDDELTGLVRNFRQTLRTLEFRTYSSPRRWLVNGDPVPPAHIRLFYLMESGSLATLKYLSLDFRELSDLGIRCISSIRLEHLSLGGYHSRGGAPGYWRVSPAGLAHIHEMETLKTLTLSGLPPVSDLFVGGCSILRSLHTLKLDSRGTLHTRHTLKAEFPSSLTQLTTLSLTGYEDMTPHGWQTLPQSCPNLLELGIRLNCRRHSSRAFGGTFNHPTLTKLWLHRCGISHQSLYTIGKGCPSLRYLSLVEDASSATLSSMVGNTKSQSDYFTTTQCPSFGSLEQFQTTDCFYDVDALVKFLACCPKLSMLTVGPESFLTPEQMENILQWHDKLIEIACIDAENIR